MITDGEGNARAASIEIKASDWNGTSHRPRKVKSYREEEGSNIDGSSSDRGPGAVLSKTPTPPPFARGGSEGNGGNGASEVSVARSVSVHANPRAASRSRFRNLENEQQSYNISNQYEDGDDMCITDHALSPASGLSILGGKAEVGLDNLGNTCFMNSILQCLLHIRPLVRHFLLTDMKSLRASINPKSPTKGVLALSFAYLCRDLHKAAQSPAQDTLISLPPSNFKKAVGAYAPHLLDYSQQDSHEFLRFLLNGMSEDLCRTPPTPHNATAAVTATAAAAAAVSSPAMPLVAAAPPTNNTGADAQTVGSTPTDRIFEDDNSEEDDDEEEEQPFRSKGGAAASDTNASLALSPVSKEWQEQDQGQGKGSQSKLSGKLRAEIARAHAPSESATAPAVDDLSTRLQNTSMSSATATASPSRLPLVTAESSPTLKAGAAGVGTEPAPAAAPPSTVGAEAGTEATPQLTAEAAAAAAWANYLRLNSSVVTDLFGGQLQSRIQCQHCNYVSRTFDPFLDICVEIPRSGSKTLLQKARIFAESTKSTLDACLQRFTAEEVLDGENMWKCDRCKQLRKAVKRLAIYKLPKVLVISFKRFRWGATSREQAAKVDADVEFPIDVGLDLRPYLADTLDSEIGDASSNAKVPTDPTSAPVMTPSSEGVSSSSSSSSIKVQGSVYDLIGVSNHSGGMGGGHYIAHCNINNSSSFSSAVAMRSQSQGDTVGQAAAAAGPAARSEWRCFNDSKVVKPRDGSGIAGPSAYLLFYQLRE
jgi:ubiquitin C-terminal hydrolase